MNGKLSSPTAREFIEGLRVSPGTMADYAALRQFHYRRGRPGVVVDVLRITHAAPTVVGRFLQREGESQTVAVLVRSLPALACRLRDVATAHRYAGLNARDAAITLNREVRCISRVIVDPRFRSLGLAVRLVRHALEHPHDGVIYTEALAAMGRVSPFFEHAGMARFDQPLRARPNHARLLDALESIGLSPAILTSRRAVEAHVQPLTAEARSFLDHELRRWHSAVHRTPRTRLKAMTFEQLRCAARDELLSRPVYYLFHHSHPIP
jgi:GNAT superfamily N-acetyltransferase